MRKVRLPAWQDLVEEQRDILETPLHESLFVVGPPGSGKTSLAIYRARMVADGAEPGTQSKQSVAFVTYNRMLRHLVGLLAPTIGVSTMHSFVGRDYRERTGRGPPTPPDDTYSYIWPRMLETLSGSDGVSSANPHIVVDEGQDLPQGFFRYASRHVANAMTVFADEEQALGDGCTSLEAIKSAAGLRDPLILAKNHRNSPEIARLAEHFHSGRLPAAEVERSATNVRPLLVQSPNLEATARRISRWYHNRADNIGVIVEREQFGRSLHNKLCNLLPQERVDYYTNTDKNETSIALLEPGVTVLNRSSVKGQEFDTVFILQLESFVPCPTDAMRRTLYMLCARARDNLFLVHGPSDLPAAALEALPGPDILERETS